MLQKIKQITLVTILCLGITSCVASVPSPTGSGATYKGWVNSKSMGLELIWPWAFLLDED